MSSDNFVMKLRCRAFLKEKFLMTVVKIVRLLSS